MKTTFTILASILLCFNLCAAKSIAPPEAKKTQVVIIGTLHKRHYKNPKYSPEILEEIILSLKPDAILIEAPLSQVDPNGRPLEKFRTKDPNFDPEDWITDGVAMQLGIKQIPFDRPDREQFYEKTDFLQRRKDYLASMKKWFEELKKSAPESADLKTVQLLDNAFTTTAQLQNGPPEIINSEGFDALTRLRRSLAFDIIPEILKKYPAYKSLFDEGHFIKDVWQERNRIMAKNIVKAAEQYPGKRLVVTTGAMHRYILRDLLKDEKSIDLKEYWEIIDTNSVKPEGNRLGTEKPDKQVEQDQVERSSK
ncbi:MAG: DUF5694 domain-containing protein [Planctomycetota bacterium]